MTNATCAHIRVFGARLLLIGRSIPTSAPRASGATHLHLRVHVHTGALLCGGDNILWRGCRLQEVKTRLRSVPGTLSDPVRVENPHQVASDVCDVADAAVSQVHEEHVPEDGKDDALPKGNLHL